MQKNSQLFAIGMNTLNHCVRLLLLGLSTVVSPAAQSETAVFVPAVGQGSGASNSPLWTTIWVYNPNPAPANVQFFLLKRDRANPSPPVFNDSIAAGQTNRYDNALWTMFGEEGFGVLRLSTDRKLLISSRIGSFAPESQVSDAVRQYLAAVPESFAIGVGQKTGLLANYQTNSPGRPQLNCPFGMVETTGSAVTARVSAFDETGNLLTTKDYDVAEFEAREYEMRELLPYINAGHVKLEVEVVSGSGKVIAFGSELTEEGSDPDPTGTKGRTGSYGSLGVHGQAAHLAAPGVRTENIHTDTSTATNSAMINANAAPITGGGTVGKIPKWTGTTPNGGFVLGDSVITELNGNIGIGSNAPASKLTVLGRIEADNTGMGTAVLGQSEAGSGLRGVSASGAAVLGTSDSGIGVNAISNSDIGVRGSSTSGTGVVGVSSTGLAGAFLGNVGISGGLGVGGAATTDGSALAVAGQIHLTNGGLKYPDGSVQTTSGITAVSHNSTLAGGGTSGSPLGVNVPLILSGSLGSFDSVLQATNTAEFGVGVVANGGPDGLGVLASGGVSDSGNGGRGVFAGGGSSDSGSGGTGVGASGGSSNSGSGGDGVFAGGGSSDSGSGGRGVFAHGGRSNSSNGGGGAAGIGGDSNNGDGGDGVFAFGGAGNRGGIGINAFGGLGLNGAISGLAGRFNGDVEITGNLSKAGGSVKIDHPLDPENKYLYHSFVESPDMMNIYNGNITTDENGEATVTLPDYFEALNRDFRYQLTVIGTFAQAIVARKIMDNRFTVKTDAPGVEVSWQVTGIRQDAYANKHRIPVDEEKSEQERGYYLHPDVFNQAEEKGIEWARHPQVMQHMKGMREQMKRDRKQ